MPLGAPYVAGAREVSGRTRTGAVGLAAPAGDVDGDVRAGQAVPVVMRPADHSVIGRCTDAPGWFRRWDRAARTGASAPGAGVLRRTQHRPLPPQRPRPGAFCRANGAQGGLHVDQVPPNKHLPRLSFVMRMSFPLNAWVSDVRRC